MLIQLLQSAKNKYVTIGQYVGSKRLSSETFQVGLLMLGVFVLAGGIVMGADAQYAKRANYNDDRIAESADLVLTYLNGSFGALVMVASGIAAILSAAFGQYRAALGLMVVAIGSFIVRSLMGTFFNDVSLQVD
jgi:uncharacterized membrane protein YsdA (DUF1294 family)